MSDAGRGAVGPPDRAVIMGVVNVTADSFSDGGRYLDIGSAVDRARALVAAGADIVDIGGESTRPGAHRVTAEVEAARVLPVIGELAADGVVCSVDTTRATVAQAALAAGARIVNDVSGGLADPQMAGLVADAGVPWILMHWRGHSIDMDALAVYRDVVDEVRRELAQRVEAALAAGVREDAIVLDPGLGFAKTAEHNWALLRALPSITGLQGPGWGFPVLIGASRKRFLGTLLADAAGPRPPAGREAATTVISGLAAAAGVWGVRVHEVADSLDAVRVAAAVIGRGPARVLCHDAPTGPVTGGHAEVTDGDGRPAANGG